MKKFAGVLLLVLMAAGARCGIAAADEDKDVAVVRENIQKIMDAYFPDDTGLQWTLLKIEKNKIGVDVTAESKPKDVGYNPVRLWVDMKGGPHGIACYIPVASGGWDLSGYEPGFDLPKHLD